MGGIPGCRRDDELHGHQAQAPPADLAPRDAKRALARRIGARFHGEDAASDAEAAFDRGFVARELPEEIEEAAIGPPNGDLHLPELLATLFGVSRSEARRKIAEGAVRLDGEPVDADALDLPVAAVDGRVLQLGKRRYRRLRAG